MRRSPTLNGETFMMIPMWCSKPRFMAGVPLLDSCRLLRRSCRAAGYTFCIRQGPRLQKPTGLFKDTERTQQRTALLPGCNLKQKDSHVPLVANSRHRARLETLADPGGRVNSSRNKEEG